MKIFTPAVNGRSLTSIALVTLGAIVALAGISLAAKPATSTQTGQNIMVNLDASGTFAIVDVLTYRCNQTTAAGLFTNTWDGNDPTFTSQIKRSSSTVVSPTSATVGSPCTPDVTIPAAPSPDASQLLNNLHPGKEDVVGQNQCNLLNGAPLTGGSYTQTAQAVGSCSYVSDSTLIAHGPSAGQYSNTTTTVTTVNTYTYTYTIAPVQVSYPALTAWDFVGSTGADTALVDINAVIAGESAISKAGLPRKYSFSLGEDITGRISRVQNLVISVNGTPMAYPGSTVFHNFPWGSLDFAYTANAGSNGVISLLVDGDALTILNTDSFAGNDNGGSDGEALAEAVMDTVPLDLPPGDFTINFTGTVKDNSGLTDLPINVTQTIHIITPGCGQGL